MVARIANFPKRQHQPAMTLRTFFAVIALLAVFVFLASDAINAMFDDWQWPRFNKGFYSGFWWAGLFDDNWRFGRGWKTGDATTGALVGGAAAMGVIIVLVVLPAFAVVGYVRSKRAGNKTDNKAGWKDGEN